MSNIWVFIGHNTGMPLEVQKCDFQPTIIPAGKRGEWVGCVPVRTYEVLAEALRIERDTCDRYKSRLDKLEEKLRAESEKGDD